MSKIIITAAITGAIHIPAMSDCLPLTPEQIVEDAVKAWKAGAAIAHIHVRQPENGKPTADVALFKEVMGGSSQGATWCSCPQREVDPTSPSKKN